ncbi:hypothetical protein B7494_g4850 [Chlorociboria aeruginascens]|nr:hypothetical protein B7494_g4850 [Chlorociboria aeruginascens]
MILAAPRFRLHPTPWRPRLISGAMCSHANNPIPRPQDDAPPSSPWRRLATLNGIRMAHAGASVCLVTRPVVEGGGGGEGGGWWMVDGGWWGVGGLSSSHDVDWTP